MPLRLEQSADRDDDDAGGAGGAVLIYVKAVPGASRDVIAGVLGDRLKVRISAPPEKGKANAAICRVIAKALGVRPNTVSIHAGRRNPEKVVRVEGLSIEQVRAALDV